MPIGVVDGYKKHDQILQQARACLCNRNVAQQRQPGVFTIRFARMNARLNQNHRFASAPGRFRRKGAALGCDQQRQFPSFATLPKTLKAYQRRRLIKSLCIFDGFGVPRCFPVISLLGVCQPLCGDAGVLVL